MSELIPSFFAILKDGGFPLAPCPDTTKLHPMFSQRTKGTSYFLKSVKLQSYQ